MRSMNLPLAVALFLVSVLPVWGQTSAFLAFTGDPFAKINISADGINASFIPYGARLTNLYVNDKNGVPQDVVLGYDDGEQYLRDSETINTYFGAVLGRYANRMKNGTFSIDGATYNIGGENGLNGGLAGYDRQNWTVVGKTSSSVTFAFYDHGFDGFPGSVINYATYAVSLASGTWPRWTSRLVSIPLDLGTPLMLTNHIPWNLGASVNQAAETVLNDTLWMQWCDRYVQTDGSQVPTGIIDVVDGPLDFSSPTTISAGINDTFDNCGTGCMGYDNDYIIDRPVFTSPEDPSIVVLQMSSPETGIQIELKTNQPSVQISTCNNLDGSIAAKASQQHSDGGTTYGQFGCVGIAPQGWIDAINNPGWAQYGLELYRVQDPPAVTLSKYTFSILST